MPPDALRIERRASPRREVAQPCKLFHVASRRFLPARTCDLSRRGVLIELLAPAPLAVGDDLAIFIAGAPIAPAGAMRCCTVVRSEPGETPRLALHLVPDAEAFAELPAAQRLSA